MLIEEGNQRLESKYFLPYFAIWFYQFLKISPKKKTEIPETLVW
jgi:hypothetical protein